MEVVKKRFVTDIEAGENIKELFLLIEKNTGRKRDGNPYLTLVFGDKSGHIRGVAWDNVDAMSKTIQAGDYVHIAATATEYRGAVQLVVKAMDPVSADSVPTTEFLPATNRDVDQMMQRLRTITDTITDENIKRLMNAFWQDAEFVALFKKAPAAKNMHHAYLGGLLVHTLSMALLADKIAGHYGGINRSVLIAGAVLHDIGKIRELSYDHRIDYTDEGRLLSHIVLGLEMVERKIGSIENFPPSTASLLKHMIVSHHGVREFGSPEVPKTIEAVLLHSIDEMDARVNGIREFMAAENSDSNWTAYHRLLERQFFIGAADNGLTDVDDA